MNVRLVVEQGARKKVVSLQTSEAVLGRSHGNAVRIPSADVSRRHCRLLLQNDLVTLEDLGSVNGTFLNGQRIEKAEIVRPGDSIEVGPVSFTVEYELTPEALSRLRSLDDPMDALAALVDGDEVEDLPMVDVADEAEDADEVLPVFDADVEEETEAIEAEFDFSSAQWQMPEGGDLRDILSHMEDDPPTEHGSAKKKRR